MPASLHEIHAPMHRTHEGDLLHGEMHDATEEVWRQPRALDAPPPREGFTQRWVREEFSTGPDKLNLSNKMREGWRPRLLSTVPDEHRTYPTKQIGDGEVIASAGLILCEMPLAIAEKRNRQIKALNVRQLQAVHDETEKVSREGKKLGYPGITRNENTRVSHSPHIQGD